MALKIYKKGAYVVINNSGKLTELNSAEVSINKDVDAIDIYEVKHNGVPVLKAQLSDILDENGVAYFESAWDIFRYEQTGSVNSSEVANPYPAPTTTVVNISSAQILAMGTTPIELLPAPGVGMYYDIETVVIEFTPLTTPYTTTSSQMYITQSNDMAYFPTLIGNVINSQLIIPRSLIVFDGVTYSSTYIPDQNSEVKLWNYDGDNPTLGDGTLRAIITYTIRTFGA